MSEIRRWCLDTGDDDPGEEPVWYCHECNKPIVGGIVCSCGVNIGRGAWIPFGCLAIHGEEPA